MKKTLLNSLLVAVGLLAGTMGAMAAKETATATVKMTYVDYDNPTTAIGEITEGNTAKSGYNSIKDGSVNFPVTKWGVDYITYIQVDASTIDGSITGATLTADCSGAGKRVAIYGVGYNSSTWSADMTYESADKTITTIGETVSTTDNPQTTFKNLSFDITDAFKNDEDKIVTLLVYETAAGGGLIKNPKVTVTYIPSSSLASCTVKYVLQGTNTELKTAATYSAEIDGYYQLTEDDKASIYANDKKYIYVSDDAASQKISSDGTTVITVTFREAGTWNYTVNAVNADNTVLKVLGKGTCFEGDKVYVPYSEYINVNGTLYQSSAQNQSFKQSVTMTADNMVANVSYAKTAITNVAFYTEGEDIEGVTIINTGNADARCSNAAAGFATEDLKFVTLPAGVYQITANVYSPTSAGGSYAIKNGEEELFSFTSGNSNRTSKTSDFIWLTEETELSISAGSKSYAYDLIYIQSIPTEPLAITSAGYATFVPTSNVKIPAAVKAYTVKVNDDKATITLGEIAADAVVKGGTAILVEGAEGSYNFAETTATETTLADNDLVAADGTEVADGTQYGLAQVDGKVGFHKIKSGETLTKGKAYLKVSDGNAAKMSFFSLNGGELTAISGVEAAKAANGEFYTLQGVRVAKPSKGLYICNGKKVIVK